MGAVTKPSHCWARFGVSSDLWAFRIANRVENAHQVCVSVEAAPNEAFSLNVCETRGESPCSHAPHAVLLVDLDAAVHFFRRKIVDHELSVRAASERCDAGVAAHCLCHASRRGDGCIHDEARSFTPGRGFIVLISVTGVKVPVGRSKGVLQVDPCIDDAGCAGSR